MSLDFSALDALAQNGRAAEDFTEATESPQLDRLVSGIEQERKQLAEAYREHQDNIKKAGQNVSAIRKGINAGEDIYSLFLTAIDTIGRMTGDRSLYDQTRSQLLAVYGIGLRETQPLQMELAEINQRLAKLTEARATADPDSRERIDRAIREHQRRAGEITQQTTA